MSAISALRRKYLHLGTGELASAGVFLFIAIKASLSAAPATKLMGFTFLPLVTILVGVGCYWLHAYNRISRSVLSKSFARSLVKLRLIHVILMLLGFLALLFVIPLVSLPHALLGSAALVFALLEHINYFYVRLAYPIQSWASEVRQCRTPRLRKDLERALRARPRHEN